MRTTADLKFALVNVVWGSTYVEDFLNYSLPTYLFPGNLPALADKAPSVYRLYTTRHDAITILASKNYEHLTKLMTVEIVDIDSLHKHDPSLPFNGKYQRMTACHHNFVSNCADDGTAMIFISPDSIIADGSLEKLANRAQEGKKVVMMTAMRVNRDSFPAALQTCCNNRGEMSPIGPRQLVTLALDHIHDDTLSYLWKSDSHNPWACAFLWEIEKSGYLMRSFHLHPLMIRGTPQTNDGFDTIDGEFVDMLESSPEDIYFATDSDEICVFDLTAREERQFSKNGPLSLAEAADWARGNTNRAHRKFVSRSFRFHAKDLDESWSIADQQSDHVVSIINSLLALSEQPDLAYSLMDVISALNLKDTALYLKLADVFLAGNDRKSAKTACSLAMNSDTTNVTALQRLALLEKEDHNLHEACKLLLAAHGQAPDNPEILQCIKELSVALKEYRP